MMAKGTKSYFRHSFFAHQNYKILDLINSAGKEAYFHYFTLVEMCAAQLANGNVEKNRFKFHAKNVCQNLMVTRQRLGGHLLAIQSSLGGHWVVTDSLVEIEYDKISEYMGSYGSYMPQLNKIKGNKIKERNNKENIPSENPTNSPPLKCLSEEVVNLYNAGAQKNGMPEIRKTGKAYEERVKKLKTAMRDIPEVEDWKKIFIVASEKGFVGKDGRQFIPNWDYIFRNKNYQQFLEEYTFTKNAPEQEITPEMEREIVRQAFGGYELE